ncbi:MAG: hypothetical protein JO166_23000 [Deltaproteobacteria bacterium]|nr:hypothetical protein [Deltaproteobacteria bacterium]
MRLLRLANITALGLTIIAYAAAGAFALQLGHEAQSVVDRLLAPPTIRAEAGFNAKMLVPPGEFYDPLFMVPRGDSVWMNDDGKATDGHGSRLLSVWHDGKISVLLGADKLLPVTGFDLVPDNFGRYAGQIFSLAQPTTGMKGALANHVVQRIDLRSHTTSVFCTLPPSGTTGKGIAGFGVDARFGPAGSAFADRFFSITALNDSIYQASADGSCKPFADLSSLGSPAGLTFSPNGSVMLVTVSPGEIVSSRNQPKGLIVSVSPDGKVDQKPVVTGLTTPLGLDVAPPGFGDYTGQIFVSDVGDIQTPVPQTQGLKRDGKVYRVTTDGKLKLVASGFVNPAGVRFVGHHLWVTDINGDFIAGGRELPDGFLVQIDRR